MAQALGLPPQNVRVITSYVGGGFGGKSSAAQAVEAARLAKATGKPVQVVWNRAEEFFYDSFPSGGRGEDPFGPDQRRQDRALGLPGVGAGEREAKTFYDVPNQRTVSAGGWQGGNPPGMHPFAVGPWRAPSVNTNTFARESHMDVLAAKAGIDPLEFRLKHLSDARMRRVLEAVAGEVRMEGRKGAQRTRRRNRLRHLLQRVHRRHGGSRGGPEDRHVQVKRVVSAVDVGLVVNPDGLRQQVEGCIAMGLGYALTEEVHFKDGEVLDRNFDSYQTSPLLLDAQDGNHPHRQPRQRPRWEPANRPSSRWAR